MNRNATQSRNSHFAIQRDMENATGAAGIGVSGVCFSGAGELFFKVLGPLASQKGDYVFRKYHMNGIIGWKDLYFQPFNEFDIPIFWQ